MNYFRESPADTTGRKQTVLSVRMELFLRKKRRSTRKRSEHAGEGITSPAWYEARVQPEGLKATIIRLL